MKTRYLDNMFLRTGPSTFLSHQAREFALTQNLYSDNLDAPAYVAGGSTVCGLHRPEGCVGSSVAFRRA
jgi:hypothetical protein